MISRRGILKSCVSAGAVIKLDSTLFTLNASRNNELDDPDLLSELEISKITKQAVDASMTFGATYADVRVIRNVGQVIRVSRDNLTIAQAGDGESVAIGVRVLVGGCFGFASSPFVDMEEAVVLAKSAVLQAKENSIVRSRDIEWSVTPKQQGRWVSPGKDPFQVPLEERLDFINAWREEAKGYRDGKSIVQIGGSEIQMNRIEKFMANSDGSDISQVLYFSQGSLSLSALSKDQSPSSGPHSSRVKGLAIQQGGWEIFEKAKAREQIPELVESAISLSKVGVTPVDVGRYELVLGGSFVAGLVGRTFGQSTQLDLAVGYEANAGGTSYLGPDPLEFLGSQVAKDTINICCDRSGTGKLATVKWDDEGVAPANFDFIRDGILVNYQTTRDTTHIIQQWHDREGTNVSSNGCASSQDGFHSPAQATPNLELLPSKLENTLDSMISSVKKGFVVYSGGISTSFNIGEGFGTGMVREIRNGRLGDFVNDFQIMFNTSEIWKSVSNVGDSSTIQRERVRTVKGQPMQMFDFSVDAPALVVNGVPVIDSMRKA